VNLLISGKPMACRGCWLSQKSGLGQVRLVALRHRQGALSAPLNTGLGNLALAGTADAGEFINANNRMSDQDGAQSENHWRDKSAAHGFSYKGWTLVNAKLVHGCFNAAFDGARRKTVALRDLFVSVAGSYGHQARQLSLSQALTENAAPRSTSDKFHEVMLHASLKMEQ